jgi:hypothetical protein
MDKPFARASSTRATSWSEIAARVHSAIPLRSSYRASNGWAASPKNPRDFSKWTSLSAKTRSGGWRHPFMRAKNNKGSTAVIYQGSDKFSPPDEKTRVNSRNKKSGDFFRRSQ